MIQTQHVEFDSRIPWLQGRQKYIGSSDAAAILGYGYAGESPSTVWGAKLGIYEKDWSKADLEMLQEGRIGEKFVVEMFANRNSTLRVELGRDFQFDICKEFPFLCASLDAWAWSGDERIPLEAKVIQHQAHEWADGNCPLKYQIQLQHQMLCIGAKRGCVIAYVCGSYQERWFDRDDEFLALAVQKYKEFWQHVIDRTPPPDSSPLAFEVQRGQVEWGTARRIGKATSDAVRQLRALELEKEKLQKKINTAKAEVARVGAGVEYLILDDQTVVKLGKRSIEAKPKLPRGIRVL